MSPCKYLPSKGEIRQCNQTAKQVAKQAKPDQWQAYQASVSTLALTLFFKYFF